MAKKKIENKTNHKSLTNRQLAALTAAIVILACGIGYMALFFSNSKQSWVKIQAQNLGYALASGKNLLTGAQKPANFVNIPILMYHHVGPLPDQADAVRKDMTVSTDNFELQVAWLKSQGYESITLNDLLQYSKGKFILPQKPVILTFDDGYSDVFDNAVPTLKKWGFVGSFAIITQFPGITQGTNQYATWQQIAQANKDGMEIVSHTQDHFDALNSHYDPGFISRNLGDSRKDLQNNAGIDTKILIYPFGHYNTQYIKLAREAGFEMGLTTKFGQKLDMQNLMELPRVRVHGNEDLETFKKVILAGEKAVGNNNGY
jgi:peptidoglycan/xylan/chitin deacetylase (PgdA/CDA1 family)